MTYARRPVGNIPELMPLYNSFNKDILQSLRFHCVLRHFLLIGKGNDEEEKKIFRYATPREIASGIKWIWESETGSTSLAQVVEDVDQALDALEIVYCAHGAAVEGLADQNGHRQQVVGDEKSGRWGGAK